MVVNTTRIFRGHKTFPLIVFTLVCSILSCRLFGKNPFLNIFRHHLMLKRCAQQKMQKRIFWWKNSIWRKAHLCFSEKWKSFLLIMSQMKSKRFVRKNFYTKLKFFSKYLRRQWLSLKIVEGWVSLINYQALVRIQNSPLSSIHPFK